MLNGQLDTLKERFPEANAASLPSGATLISVPDVSVPLGWSARKTTVRFLAPTGYPYAAPDCFWADCELRLATGAMPVSSAVNPIPETSLSGLWFSWHLTHPWNPNIDNLLTWMATVEMRFRSAA